MLKKQYLKIQPWTIWFVATLFFFCEYFARVDPSVMVPHLMHAFSANALQIGNLSLFFYIPYIIMQIPVGMILDRHNPRYWLFAAAFISFLGALLFATAQALWMAKFGRFLIGFGASFAFVGTLKLATLWFEHKKLGLLAGLTQGSGMLGAAFAEGFFVKLVMHIGWRSTMLLIACTLLIFALLILLVVRAKPTATKICQEASQPNKALLSRHNLINVLSNTNTWVNALYAGFLFAPTAALAELWGVTFFHHVYSISKISAGLLMSCIFLGWAIGSPLVGFISDAIHKRKPIMIGSAFASTLILLIILYMPHLSLYSLYILCFLYGMCNTGVAISYAVASEIHTKQRVGLSIALTNMSSITIGALLQPVIGWLLDLQWSGTYQDGIRHYSIANYHQTLTICPICLIVALLLSCWIKETATPQQQKN